MKTKFKIKVDWQLILLSVLGGLVGLSIIMMLISTLITYY